MILSSQLATSPERNTSPWLMLHLFRHTGMFFQKLNRSFLAIGIFLSTIVATEHFDLSQWPETQAWYARVKGEIKNYEKANGEGAGAFGGWFKMMNQ